MATSNQNSSAAGSAGESTPSTTGQPGAQNTGAPGTGLPNFAQFPVSGTTVRVPAAVGQILEPKRLLWYGGLAALGVVGVLEWPIVAVVGAGTYLAERFARDDAQASQQQQQH